MTRFALGARGLTQEDVIARHRAGEDVWVFAYASLIWRPDFNPEESRPARVLGLHRALKMWSRINRGTPERPGLVFALLSGGSCNGLVLKLPQKNAIEIIDLLWAREMPLDTYTPKWVRAHTQQGLVSALAFTLSRRHPQFAGDLSPAQYREIFQHSSGRYGSTADYALETLQALEELGIPDRALQRLIQTHWATQSDQTSLRNSSASDLY